MESYPWRSLPRVAVRPKPFPTYYRGPFVASKYCESTPRSQVNLSHDSSRARQAVGRGMRTPSRLRYRGPFVASKYRESTMPPVYHAKITVSTKNFLRSEGRKCSVKGLDQWRGLMVRSRSWFRRFKREIPLPQVTS